MNDSIRTIATGKRLSLVLNKILLDVKAGIKQDEFLVLWYVCNTPEKNITIMKTSRDLGMSLITHTLDKLEKKQLITRVVPNTKKEGDRREIYIQETKQGQNKLDFIASQVRIKFPNFL